MLDPDSAQTIRLHPAPAAAPRMSRRTTITALLVVGLLAAAAGVALYIAVRAFGDAGALSAQNRHLQNQVTSLQVQVHGLTAKERSDYMTAGELLAPLVRQATDTCSQDLTGAAWPGHVLLRLHVHQPLFAIVVYRLIARTVHAAPRTVLPSIRGAACF